MSFDKANDNNKGGNHSSSEFNAHSEGKGSNARRDRKGGKGGVEKEGVSKITKAELLACIANKLPPIGATKFKMGNEEIDATPNQKTLVNLIETKTITMVSGPFGSGKTFWTCKAALEGLVEKRFTQIALTAPAVEADEELGFMPGDKDEKMAGHVNQLIETIEDLVGKKTCQDMIETGLLLIAPHAFNRGRTYKNTFYILDESQNASGRQLMTSLGRLGYNSTFVYMGDNKQNDRTTQQDSAFVAFKERFNKAAYAEDIGSVTLTAEDVRRHPLLKKIVENGDDAPLQGFENRQDSKISRRPS